MEKIKKLLGAFNEISDIGVIWVIDEAAKLGYYNGNPEWANLGQGEPEVGEMPGAPDRIKNFSIEPGDDRYGPLNGMAELRTAIAAYYNRLYRQEKKSQYTAANVSIAMGGRLALTRIFSIFGTIKVGYKVPEYPAYEDLFNYQLDRVTPICIPTRKEDNYAVPPNEFATIIGDYKLDAFLLSNPCNSTGHVIKGDALNTYLTAAKKQNCALIIDEVYSHFIYENSKPAAGPISGAAYIEDVNNDAVLIVDGLTKSFRYPGWRLAWILGPTNIIEDLGRAASGIDGGPSMPIQRAAIQLLEPERANKETQALREVFSHKQSITLAALREFGMLCSTDANSTFYIWADISQLPPPLNNSESFFKEALKHKVLVVPGHLFDIDPRKQKKEIKFHNYIRCSFGPEEANLVSGLRRIEQLIKSFT